MQSGKKICLCKNYPREEADHFLLDENRNANGIQHNIDNGEKYEPRACRNCDVFFERDYQQGACANDLLVPEEDQELLACPACVDEKYFQMREDEARRAAALGRLGGRLGNGGISDNPNVRQCPFEGCEFVAERIGGCAHITCAVNRSHHFCILCGFKSNDGQLIYRHMDDHKRSGEFTTEQIWGFVIDSDEEEDDNEF